MNFLYSYCKILECGISLIDLPKSNIYLLWILHQTSTSMLFDICCFQTDLQYVVKNQVVSSNLDPEAISCAEYSDDILAVGTSLGSVHLHQSVNAEEVFLF